MVSLVRLGNAFGVAGITLVLLAALVAQFALKELPCPLCELQRVAFTMCGFGFLLNVRFGSRPVHYGLILVGALFGVAAAGRQVLLHIVPGTGAYGSPLLGLHYYSWAFLLFVAIIVAVCVLLLMGGGIPAEHDRRESRSANRLSGIARFISHLLIVVTLANAALSFAQCGFGNCPDNPTDYWLLRRF